jgi:hypothetical protein
MQEGKPTTFRFTEDDLQILAKLRKTTGLSAVAAIRLAIRESLAAREPRRRKETSR